MLGIESKASWPLHSMHVNVLYVIKMQSYAEGPELAPACCAVWRPYLAPQLPHTQLMAQLLSAGGT